MSRGPRPTIDNFADFHAAGRQDHVSHWNRTTGVTFFTAAKIAVKLLGDDLSLGQIVFAPPSRTISIVLFFLVSKAPCSGHFAHASGSAICFGASSAARECNRLVFRRLPLSDAQAIAFASPLIGVILAAVMLKKVQIYRWSAVMIGYSGVTMILPEHVFVGQNSDRDPLGALFARVRRTAGAGIDPDSAR